MTYLKWEGSLINRAGSISLPPRMPAGASVQPPGSDQGVNWNAGLPVFGAVPVAVPVEVRSNARQVKIAGEVTALFAQR